MGNRLKTNPIVIDTTDTAIPGPLIIQAMAWIGSGAETIIVGNRLRVKIKNANGGIILDVKVTDLNDANNATSTVGFQMTFPRGWHVPDGLYVEDIDGGELHIWV